MNDNMEYEEQLEKEEKKHKKIMKYDMEIGIILLIVVVVVTVSNLMLKSSYESIKEVRAGIGPLLMESNKDILNAAETFRKNSTDSASIAAIDKAKLTYDNAILFYSKTMKKGMEEGLVVTVLDTCFTAGNNFRTALEAQPEVLKNGLTVQMLNAVDNDMLRLRGKIDSLVAGIGTYNNSGFLLHLSSLTPYPGKVEFRHQPLPEVALYREPVPAPAPDKK